jgi:hypothetical protein
MIIAFVTDDVDRLQPCHVKVPSLKEAFRFQVASKDDGRVGGEHAVQLFLIVAHVFIIHHQGASRARAQLNSGPDKPCSLLYHELFFMFCLVSSLVSHGKCITLLSHNSNRLFVSIVQCCDVLSVRPHRSMYNMYANRKLLHNQ